MLRRRAGGVAATRAAHTFESSVGLETDWEGEPLSHSLGEIWRIERVNIDEGRPASRLGLISTLMRGTLARLRGAREALPRPQDLITAVVVAIGYFLGAEIAFAVGTLSNLFAPLWPPNMILLCALLLAPSRLWWLYIAAVLPAHIAAEAAAGMPALEYLGAFVCNVALALGIALALKRFDNSRPWLGSLAKTWLYIILAAVVAPATVALGVAAAGFLTDGTLGSIPFAIRWFLANLVGALTLAPLLLTWIGDGVGWITQSSRRDYAQVGVVSAAVVAGAYLGFAFAPESTLSPALACIAIPPILWATVQFGTRGASGAICVTTIFALAGSIRGFGPFLSISPDQTILSLQMFIAVTSASFLVLAAVIEERQRSHTQIILAEQKLQSILDNTPACVTVRDLAGRYILANRSAREKASMPGDFVGKTCHDIFPQEIANTLCASDASVAQGQSTTNELTFGGADRSRVYLSSKFALRDTEGGVYGVCTVSSDITDHKRSMAALEASEANFRLMAETVPAILFTADRNGRWEYASQRFFDVVGVTANGGSIPNWTGFVHPEDLPRVSAAWRQSITMGEAFEHELRIRSLAGAYCWFAARCRPIRNAAGQIERWFGAAFEIDTLKTIESELRRANATQSAILGSISDFYYTLDDRLRITAINPKAAKLVGLEVSQAVGRALLEVYPNFRGTTLVRACRRALRRPTALHLEVQYSLSPPQWLDVNIYPHDGGGISVFSRDISERKRAERALYELSSRLLRSQDEERRRIARELHDGMAQNITAVELNLHRVYDRCSNIDPESREILEDSILLIKQSLSELRTLSYWLHPPLLDEIGLMPALHWYVEGFTRRSGIKIGLRLPPDVGRLGQDVETALFRVVQESLGNVRRHSGADAATISLSLLPTRVALTISDNGRGMTPGVRMDPSADSEDIPSLGVGIAGMRARLKQLGGTLEIASSPRGTTVRAVIPRTEHGLQRDFDGASAEVPADASPSDGSPAQRELTF
jgi:two-component system, NarL family, sensor kinase